MAFFSPELAEFSGNERHYTGGTRATENDLRTSTCAQHYPGQTTDAGYNGKTCIRYNPGVEHFSGGTFGAGHYQGDAGCNPNTRGHCPGNTYGRGNIPGGTTGAGHNPGFMCVTGQKQADTGDVWQQPGIPGHYQDETGHYLGVSVHTVDNTGSAGYHPDDIGITGHDLGGKDHRGGRIGFAEYHTYVEGGVGYHPVSTNITGLNMQCGDVEYLSGYNQGYNLGGTPSAGNCPCDTTGAVIRPCGSYGAGYFPGGTGYHPGTICITENNLSSNGNRPDAAYDLWYCQSGTGNNQGVTAGAANCQIVASGTIYHPGGAVITRPAGGGIEHIQGGTCDIRYYLGGAGHNEGGKTDAGNHPGSTTGAGNYPQGTTGAGNYPQGTTEAGNYPQGTTGAGNYSQGTTGVRNYPQGTTGAGNYPQGTSGAGNYPQGTTGAGNYAQGTTGAGNYPQGTTGAGNYAQGTTGAGNYPQGTTGAGNYPQGTTGAGNYAQGITGAGNYPQGTTGAGNYSQGTTGVRNYPQGTTGAGNYPQGTSGAGNYAQGTTGAGNYPQGTTGAGNYPQGTTGAGNYPQGTTGAGNYPQGTTGAGNYAQGITGAGNYPQGTTGAGNYSQGTTGVRNYPQGTTGAGNYPQGTSGAGNYAQGTTGTGNYAQGTTGAGNYPQGTTGAGNYAQGTTGAGNYPQGITGAGNYPQGTTGAGNYSQGTTGVRNYPQGTTGAGNYPQGTSGAGNYPQGTTGAGNYAQGTTGAGNYPQGTTGAGNYSQGTTGAGNYAQGTTGAGNYPQGSPTGAENYSSVAGGAIYPDGTSVIGFNTSSTEHMQGRTGDTHSSGKGSYPAGTAGAGNYMGGTTGAVNYSGDTEYNPGVTGITGHNPSAVENKPLDHTGVTGHNLSGIENGLHQPRAGHNQVGRAVTVAEICPVAGNGTVGTGCQAADTGIIGQNTSGIQNQGDTDATGNDLVVTGAGYFPGGAGVVRNHPSGIGISGHNTGGTCNVGNYEHDAGHKQVGTTGARNYPGGPVGTGNHPGGADGTGCHHGGTGITVKNPGSIKHKPGGTGGLEYYPCGAGDDLSGTVDTGSHLSHEGSTGYNPHCSKGHADSTGSAGAMIAAQKLTIQESSACMFLASQDGNMFLRETEDIHKCSIKICDKTNKYLQWENRPFFYDGWCQTDGKRVTIVLGRLCDLESRMVVIPSDRCFFPAEGFEECFRGEKDGVMENCVHHLTVKETSETKKANLGYCFFNDNAGSLPYSIICHMVCFDSDIQNRKQKVCTKDNLTEALKCTISKAANANLNSLALPVCDYGGPSVDIQISAVKKMIEYFLTETLFKKSKQEIFLCFTEKKEADILKKKLEKLFKNVEGKPFNRLIFNVSRNMKGLKGQNYIKIELRHDQLHNVKADVIVNTTHCSLDLQHGFVSKAILAAAGPELQDECRKHNSLNLGQFITTGPGKLKTCKNIFHGALPMWDPVPGKSEQILKCFMENCLLEASRNGMKSIAFPSLGTGNLKFPWHQVAMAMYESVEDFERQKNTSLETVMFVICPGDKFSEEAFTIEEKRRIAKKKQNIQKLPVQQCNEEILEGLLKLNNKTVKIRACKGDINQEPFDCTLIWLEKCDHNVSNCHTKSEEYLSAAIPSSSSLHNEFKIHASDKAEHLYKCLCSVFKKAMQKRHTVLSIKICKSFSKVSAGGQAEQIIRALNDPDDLTYLLEVHLFVNSSEDLRSVQSNVAEMSQNKQGRWAIVTGGSHKPIDGIKLRKAGRPSRHNPQPPFEVSIQSHSDELCGAAVTRMKKYLCGLDTDISDENDEMRDYSITSVFQTVKGRLNFGFLESCGEAVMNSLRTRTKVNMTQKDGNIFIAGTMDQVLSAEGILLSSREQEQLKCKDDPFQDEMDYLTFQANFNEYSALLFSLNADPILEITQITFKGGIRITCNKNCTSKVAEIISSLLNDVRRSNWDDIVLKQGEEISFALSFDDSVLSFLDEGGRTVILFSKSSEKLESVKHKIKRQLGRTFDTDQRRIDLDSLQTSTRTNSRVSLTQDSKTNVNIPTEKLESTFFSKNGVIIKVYIMHITKTNVECIVNATDVQMTNSYGISKAVANAAGKDFEDACQKHIRLNGALKKDEIVVLASGLLEVKWIVNIASPKDLSQLENIIVQSLNTADSRGFRSIALPSISAGFDDLDIKLCAQQYYKAVERFNKEAEGQLNLKEIHFVDSNKEMTQVIQATFAQHFPSQIANFCSSPIKGSQLSSSSVPAVNRNEIGCTEYSNVARGKTFHSHEIPTDKKMSPINRCKDVDIMFSYPKEKTVIKVIHGDICEITTGALVSIEDENWSGNSEVARALLAAGGNTYKQKEHSKVKIATRSEKVVVTRAGELKCDHVLHVIAPQWGLETTKENQTFRKNVQETMLNIMDAACNIKVKSFALPLIGTSSDQNYETSLTPCCEAMIDGLHQWIKFHSGKYQFQEVILICFDIAASKCFTDVLNVKLKKEGIDGGRATRETQSETSHFQSKSVRSTNSLDTQSKENCVICMEAITDPKVLTKCGHTFCRKCIDQQFKYKPACPCCALLYGKITGNQPKGTMNVHIEDNSLPGFKMCGTIVISYEFNGGKQKEEHPHPGRPYSGTKRKAYLPNNERGNLVLRLLQEAFNRRLVFTIGTSRTTGQEDTVTWNDIHHKTNRTGGPQKFGYPDETYLDRIMEELAVKGVTEESLE